MALLVDITYLYYTDEQASVTFELTDGDTPLDLDGALVELVVYTSDAELARVEAVSPSVGIVEVALADVLSSLTAGAYCYQLVRVGNDPAASPQPDPPYTARVLVAGDLTIERGRIA